MSGTKSKSKTDRDLHPVHRIRPMVGRDPTDPHRAATPLELLYDLVFVISFGLAANEFAHLVAEGYVVDGLKGFIFAMFAVLWAWINFTWFASAFDTDDWWYRLSVMTQMIGVVFLALGLHDMFESIHNDDPFNIRVAVVGYVIMRVPLIVLWLRVAHDDPEHGRSARLYAASLAIAQVLWCVSAFFELRYWSYIALVTPVFLLELAGPVIAEVVGEGTPWHPHHIAERYGLMAIIALGEVLIGTVAAIDSLVNLEGWTSSAVGLAVLGVSLTFGLWWTYFNLPAGHLLEEDPRRGFVWGYGHFFIYTSIAATGAGLHVIALYLEHHAEISATGAIAAAAIPAGIYSVALVALSAFLLSTRRWIWIVLAVVLFTTVLSVVAVGAGLGLLWGMAILTAAPWVGVVGQEFFGSQDGETLSEV